MLRFLARTLLVMLMLAAMAAGAVWWWLSRPLPVPAQGAEVSIEAGALPREVAAGWVQAGVDVPEDWLYAWFRFSGQARRIRAGSYKLEPGESARDLLAKLVSGEGLLERITLVEGRSFRQWRAELARAKALKPASAAMGEAELMAALGMPGVAPEGRFFPDTYLYSPGVTDLTVMKRAAQAMRRHLEQAWAQRAPGLALASADEALVLASIVEKETGQAADRARIAGVFINRLKIGMPLQTDPSVIYGLGEAFDGDLRKRDLQADTPYNTYTRRGLPPTPIAMPGLASLRAAVQPEATTALYFVARGDGSSVFSDDLDAHNRAVNRYQRRAAAATPAPEPAR